jgi:ABC-2 type transport system permease protein
MSAHVPIDDRPRAGEWLQEVLALARRWFIMLRRERLNLVFSVVQPAIWLIFFGLGMGRAIDTRVIGADYLGFVLPGIIAFTVIGNGVSSAMPLLFDKEDGYLDKLMTMPIARSSVIMSRFLYQTVLLAGQVALVLGVAFAMGVRLASGPAGFVVLMLAVALLTLAVTAAFLALAYAVPGHGTFFAITGFATLPLLFISNAFVPFDAMPGWMAVLARLNPLSYAISSMRILVLEGWTVELLGALGVLAACAAVLLAWGTWEFRRHTGGRVG